MPSSSVSRDTPVQVVSSFDHLVTQWMSTVTVSPGSARSSSHVHETGSSTAPWIVKLHQSIGWCGVGPAESTGKSSVTYWPGGTRDGSASARRRPWKPREIGDIVRVSLNQRADHVPALEPHVVAGEGSRTGGVELERRPRRGGHEAGGFAEVLVHLGEPLHDLVAEAPDVGGRPRALVQLERDREPLLRVLVLGQHEREGLDDARELGHRVDGLLDVRGRDLAAVVGDGVVGAAVQEEEREV